MTPSGRVIPVYPTFAGLTPPRRSGTPWRTWFPFTSPAGEWTFSGRVALYQGLPSLSLPVGSTILVPNYHQGVEIDTLLAAGYKVRYYRVDERLEADLRDAQRRVDATVSALYITHYFGFPQPLPAIRDFCQAHRLKLIEDCALSLFSRHDGTWLGSEGDLALFSVYKTLPLPHGGFVVTKDDRPRPALRPVPFGSTAVQTVDLIRKTLRASGWAAVDRWTVRTSRALTRLIHWNRTRTITTWSTEWDSRPLGHAASRWILRLMQWVDPDRVVARRRANFARLAAHLEGCVPCPLPYLAAGTCPLLFPIMVSDKVRFKQDLAGLGVESVNLWSTSHPTCPPELAAEVSHWRHHCLELPIHQELDEDHIDRVAMAVRTALERQGSQPIQAHSTRRAAQRSSA